MSSVDELRAEARRLRKTISTISDPALKQQLAARALELAERAEAMARLPEDPYIIGANIERYRNILATGIDDRTQRRAVEEMLRDAEQMLGTVRGKS